MSRYGNDFYGLSYYGTDTLVDFDASPFSATPIDYNKILIQWNLPTGDWDKLRLVRNTFGFPMTPDDGDILTEFVQDSDERTYLDEGAVPNNSRLIEGQVYYYSVFVRNTGNKVWARAGTALAVSVKNYGTAEIMYEYLPTIYKINNTYSALDNDASTNNDLFNFLQIFAFEYDFFKTLAENVSRRYDVLRLDGRLIPALLNQFGFTFEQEVGLQQARVLLKNAIKIYSELGSTAGLRTYVTAFTGFNCDVKAPKNIMLGLDDSSFRETLGFWENKNNAELNRGTLASESPAVEPYQEPLSPSNFPNAQVGYLKITAETSGDIELVCGESKIRTKAVPVEPGAQYTLSLYTRAKDEPRGVVTDILWYSVDGVFLGSAGESTITNVVGLWTRTTGSTGSAPALARFAVPYVRIEGCDADEVHYVDAVQFEEGPTPTTFVDARRIDVILKANRINEILNPSFEVNYDTWDVVGAIPLIFEDGAVEFSTNCLQLEATAVSAQAFTDYTLPVIGGDQHAASAWVKGPVGTTSQIVIRWFTESLEETGVSVETSLELTGEWQRIFLEAVAPTDARLAKLVIIFNGAVSDQYKIDAVLFEKAAYVVPYFDGSTGYAQIGDILWEGGTPHQNRSHYYKNRESATVRLIATLQNYIPAGSSWAVFVAQPD